MVDLHSRKNQHKTIVKLLLAIKARLTLTPVSTAKLYDQLTQAYLELGKLTKAAAALKWMKDHPTLFETFHIICLCLTLGQKYADLDKPCKALKCYQQSLKLAMANVKKSRKYIPLAAQCRLAKADLPIVQSQESEQEYQQIQDLYKREGVQPDNILAGSYMQHGLLLWNRNELKPALEALNSAWEIHQHVAAPQANHATVLHNRIMTLQYLILLHADLGQPERALSLLQNQLDPLVQSLPHQDLPYQPSFATLRQHGIPAKDINHQDLPRQLSLTTVRDQARLLDDLPT